MWKDATPPRAYVTALLSDAAVAERVVESIAETGVPTDEMCIAMDDAQHLANFCSRTHTVAFESPFETQLLEAGVPFDRASRCDQEIKAGRVLLFIADGIHADNVAEILREAGADVEPRSEASLSVADNGATTRIPLRAENLHVYKERIDDCNVELRKEVITEVQHIEVAVAREDLVITRNGKDSDPQSIRIPLQHEEVSIQKQTVLAEEVSIEREQSEEVRHFTEAVRHEELRVLKDDDSLVVNDSR